MDRLTVALTMRPAALADHLFDDAAWRRLDQVATVHPMVLEDLGTAEAEARLAVTDVLVTGWGAPPLDDETLARMPRLRAVVGTGGGAGRLGHAAYARDLTITNARLANSRPVAEYALAMIVLAGKQAFRAGRMYADRRASIDREQEFATAGNYRRTVGIVGASTTGRLTIELLRPFGFTVLVYDPYLTAADAADLGVRAVGLEELLSSASIVSLHAPEIPATRKMIGAAELARLPDGATVINTARGSVVDTEALVAELTAGRIEAILDVTDPEPLPPGHPLWQLPNAILTPHIAGSMGNELRRLGEAAVTEVERIAAGLPPLHPERREPVASV